MDTKTQLALRQIRTDNIYLASCVVQIYSVFVELSQSIPLEDRGRHFQKMSLLNSKIDEMMTRLGEDIDIQ